MKNTEVIFQLIKEHCTEVGALNHSCYSYIESQLAGKKEYMPTTVYFEFLSGLGLIEFYRFSKTVILTEKGRQKDTLFGLENDSQPGENTAPNGDY